MANKCRIWFCEIGLEAMSCELCNYLGIRRRCSLFYGVAPCILSKTSYILPHHRSWLMYPDLQILPLVLIICVLDITNKAWHWVRYLGNVLFVRSYNLIFVLAHIYRTLDSPYVVKRIFRGAEKARRLTNNLYWGEKHCSFKGKYAWSNFGELSVIQ